MAEGRNAQARDAALVAAAGGELAEADSRAQVLENDYAQRRDEIARLRAQLQVEAPAGEDERIPAPLEEAGAMTPAMRLQALETDPRYAGLAAYERLQARQALQVSALRTANLRYYVCVGCGFVETYLADDKHLKTIADKWKPE